MLLRRGTPQEAGMIPERIAQLNKTVKRWVDDGLTPTAMYLLAHKGIIFAHNAYGSVDSGDTHFVAKPDTIIPLSSISKVITATAAMILAEEGKLTPTKTVSYYIPEFKGENKESVCVYHLMTHTSGMSDDVIWEHSEKNRDKIKIPPHEKTQDPGIHEWLYMGYEAPLWKKPGEEMNYCNYGFELLGEIIRRVSGMSLPDFANERIFKPLGMKDTSFGVPDSKISRVLHMPENAIYKRAVNPRKFKSFSACGGAFSTLEDLAIFGQMFLNKGTYNGVRILSKATVASMTRNQIPGVSSLYNGLLFKEATWGLGWCIHGDKKDEGGILRSPSAYSHSGAGCSFLFVDPEYEIVLSSFITTMNYSFGYNPLRRFDILVDATIGAIAD